MGHYRTGRLVRTYDEQVFREPTQVHATRYDTVSENDRSGRRAYWREIILFSSLESVSDEFPPRFCEGTRRREEDDMIERGRGWSFGHGSDSEELESESRVHRPSKYEDSKTYCQHGENNPLSWWSREYGRRSLAPGIFDARPFVPDNSAHYNMSIGRMTCAAESTAVSLA